MNGDDLHLSATPAPSREEKLKRDGLFISADGAMDTSLSKLKSQELLRDLSPPFLISNDAARYAMAQIDRRKGRFTGGYILSDPDGHCRATQPLEGALEDFLFEGELVMEAVWDRLLPEGYRYLAYYFCEADNSAQLKRLRPSWSARRIDLTESLPAGRIVAACSGLVQGAYVIGPQGSLVRFVVRDSRQVAVLPLPPERQPVERYVHDLLERGTLSVVLTSPVWVGWRGEVSSRWKAYAADTEPTNTDPFFSAVYGDAQGAMAFAQQLLLRNPKAMQLGFLLKHASLARFVVTEPVGVNGPLFDPHLVFRSASDGTFLVPRSYRLAGFYSLAIDAPAPRQVDKPWLYERFIQPRVLAHAINVQRALDVPGLALYVSTVDGALLRYEFSNSTAESDFYNPPEAMKQGIDNGRQAALDEGRLAVRTYIQQLAGAGDLSVIITSELWDVAGRIDMRWQPYSRHPLTALSQGFVLADDAARYAHERIGSRRKRGFIGLILKGPQQRFFATQPLENQGARFDFSWVGPVDRAGIPVVIPAGYSLHGMYSSRAYLAVAVDDDEARLAAQMYVDSDIHQVLILAPKIPLAYLSGAADSLIAFEPYGPELTRELYDMSAPERGGSQLHRQLQDQTLVPSDVVRAMVLAGVLRVVVGNRLWGSPARVESDWSPPYVLAPDNVPAQPRLGPIFTTAQEAVIDACAVWRRAYAQAPHGLGVVLKSKTSDEFVATQVVPGAVLDRLIFAAEFGAPILTQSFTVHAMYYCASGLERGFRGQIAWVGRHFIGPQDLYAALYDQRGRRRARVNTLALYLSPLDGALLLFDTGYDPLGVLQDESGAMDPNALQAKLEQTLSARGYVRQVALGGQLRVIVTNSCWSVAGHVGPLWVAFAQADRHLLGPCFASADDAARHAQIRLGSRRDRVYGGLILRRTDGLFTATEPVSVYVENFAPGWIRRDDLVVNSQFLGGSTAVARYHSRRLGELPFALDDGERAVYQNMFTTDFLGAMLDDSPTALRYSTGLEYLFCDDGALLSVASQGGARERSLAAKLTVRGTAHPKHNELEQSLRDGALTPSEYVSRVARALVLRVVKSSTLWGRAARVEQWQAAAMLDTLPALTVDAALGPVFVQLTDALQYVHRQSGQRRQLSFGVVLKARKAEQYLASTPQPAGGLALSLDRLLVEGVPPTGLEVLGIYLCPPAQAGVLQDDPLYRYFVSPADLTRAWGLRGAKPSEYLPVFVGCVDGAWLQLVSRSPLVSLGDALPRLKSGALKPLAYVRQVAQAHELNVLVSSEIWGAKGRVGSSWESRRSVSQPGQALALGPLFSHPDDAARYALRRVGRGLEVPFLGLVLVNTASTSFVALEPLRDTGIDSPLPRHLFRVEGGLFEPSSPAPAYPSGFKLVAAHLLFQRMPGNSDDTAQDQRLAKHFVARDTLGFYRNLLFKNGVRGAFCYLSTRQGGLLKYVPRYTEREEDLFSGGLLGPTDYPPTQWLSRLASDGVVQVLDPDDYWTRSGVLKVDWTLEAGEEHSAWEVEPTYPARDEL